MKDFTSRYPGRCFDVLFYVDTVDLRVEPVQAFTCAPNDDSVRWVPQFGCSTCVGGSVFSSEAAAYRELHIRLLAERNQVRARLSTLDAYLGSHTS